MMSVGVLPENLETKEGKSAQQVYATHCARNDSFQEQDGFGIRARSSDDPDVTRFVLNVPAYRLPDDMQSEDPNPSAAPVRLARVVMPDGRVALVHTTLVRRDIFGRPGNYFSHFLVYDNLTSQVATQAWDSPRWRREYAAGCTKTLTALDSDPAGNRINDRSLSDFLRGEGARDENLSTSVFPDRLRNNAERCRRLLRKAMSGLRLIKEGQVKHRGRLFIRAEPGLVALLVYGLSRLLPKKLVSNLTFSTFESAHRTLREFGYGQIVGTYTKDVSKDLGQDVFSLLGYGLDSFLDKASPELEQRDDFLEHLIDLAASGDWPVIDDYRNLWALNEEPTFDSLHQATKVRKQYRQLVAKSVVPEDIGNLPALPLGEKLLLTFEDFVIPNVLEWWGSSEEIPKPLAKWLQHRVQKLQDQAVEAITAADGTGWQRPLKLILDLVPEPDRERWFFSFVQQTRRERSWSHLYKARKELLRLWSTYAEANTIIPASHTDLLETRNGDELRDLVRNPVRALWSAQAISLCLDSHDRRRDAVAVLRQEAFALESFCQYIAIAQEKGVAVVELLVHVLSPPEDPDACRFFGSLIESDLHLPSDTWERLFDRIRADSGAWINFWQRESNLARLSELLPPHSVFVQNLWEVLARQVLHREYLVSRELPEKIWASWHTLEARWHQIPDKTRGKLDAWKMIRTQCWNPNGAGFTPEELSKACDRLGIKEIAELLIDCFSPVVRKMPFTGIMKAVRGFVRTKDSEAMFEVVLEILKQFPGDVTPYHTALLREMPIDRQLDIALAYSDKLYLDEGTEMEVLEDMKRRSRWKIYLYGSLFFLAGSLVGYVLGNLVPVF